jgi:CarD family transcriptional regulator
MFVLEEKVVYPGHGVAKISRIIEKKISGATATFFELKFLNKEMTILVPIHNLDSVGIRRLSSTENINDIFKFLAQPAQVQRAVEGSAASNWNKRNKEYQIKLRTGNLRDICSIYRDLQLIASQKELSFGEKNLLHQTEMLIVQEISLVNKVGEEKAAEQLRALFKPAHSCSSFSSSAL